MSRKPSRIRKLEQQAAELERRGMRLMAENPEAARVVIENRLAVPLVSCFNHKIVDHELRATCKMCGKFWSARVNGTENISILALELHAASHPEWVIGQDKAP
jgi:hypothetical protein